MGVGLGEHMGEVKGDTQGKLIGCGPEAGWAVEDGGAVVWVGEDMEGVMGWANGDPSKDNHEGNKGASECTDDP